MPRLQLIAENVCRERVPFVLDGFTDPEPAVVAAGSDPRKDPTFRMRISFPNEVDPGQLAVLDQDVDPPRGIDPSRLCWRAPWECRFRFNVHKFTWGDIEITPERTGII